MHYDPEYHPCNAVIRYMGVLIIYMEPLIFQDLVVRLCFVLGNVTARSDSARGRVAAQPRAIETLLDILKHYLELDIKVKKNNSNYSRTFNYDNHHIL